MDLYICFGSSYLRIESQVKAQTWNRCRLDNTTSSSLILHLKPIAPKVGTNLEITLHHLSQAQVSAQIHSPCPTNPTCKLESLSSICVWLNPMKLLTLTPCGIPGSSSSSYDLISASTKNGEAWSSTLTEPNNSLRIRIKKVAQWLLKSVHVNAMPPSRAHRPCLHCWAHEPRAVVLHVHGFGK